MRFFLSVLMLAAALSASAARAEETRTLSMAGHGEVRAAPDMAMIEAGVTSDAATAAGALAANSEQMRRVMAALDELGMPARAIQTSNVSVAPQYAGGNNAPPRLTGYQVSNTLLVELDDIAKVGKTLDTLVGAGANQMNGIRFGIADPTAALEKARSAAVADARRRAQTYAAAAGVALGPILRISEGSSDVRPLRLAAPAFAFAKSVPVAAGEETVSADVELVWDIH